MPSNADALKQSEILIMLAIQRLTPSAYGVTIRDEIAKETGNQMTFGVLYSVLSRLQQNGLLSSKDGEATAERGGRAKKYFAITGKGQRTLQSSLRSLDRLRGLTIAPAFQGDFA